MSDALLFTQEDLVWVTVLDKFVLSYNIPSTFPWQQSLFATITQRYSWSVRFSCHFVLLLGSEIPFYFEMSSQSLHDYIQNIGQFDLEIALLY